MLKYFIYVIIGLFILFTFSCSKDQQPLKLDSEYFSVSDLLQYCQGSCNETYDWEHNPAWVKGRIVDVQDTNTIQNYYDNDRFFLTDIRTGINMEIKISADRDAIINIIQNGIKTDIFYIKGKAEPMTAITDEGCTKGMRLSINDDTDLSINN
jgi:hypothetical protein